MNKLICPDCEQETDKLVSTTGTCIQCYKRYQNMKTRGLEYVKLKDIKGTKEYNRVMGRRNGTSRKTKKVNNIKSQPKIKDLSDINVIKTEIQKMNKYPFIDVVPNSIYNALLILKTAMDRKDEIENLASIISEDLLVLSHDKEHTNGPGDPKFEELQRQEFVLLKYRRLLKDTFVYLNVIKQDAFTDELKNLDDVKSRLEKNEYTPKYKTYNQYKVSVNVSGLNGSSRVESFERQVYAENEKSARSYVEDFLNKLNSVTIFGKTWKILEVQKNVSFKKN